MTIDLSGVARNSQLSQSVLEPATTSAPDQTPKALAASGSDVDRTTFQSAPSTIRGLVNTALASPEIRQDKVDSLRQSISNGTYSFNAGKVADAMIASTRWS